MFACIGGEGFLERGSAEERKIRLLAAKGKNGVRLAEVDWKGKVHELDMLRVEVVGLHCRRFLHFGQLDFATHWTGQHYLRLTWVV